MTVELEPHYKEPTTRRSVKPANRTKRTGERMWATSKSHYWHRWFAWRPVVVSSRTGRRRVVWLQYLERRWTAEGITSGLGPRWVYRRTQSKQ
jgi:hypothetical protein